jgi:hypothetical protein
MRHFVTWLGIPALPPALSVIPPNQFLQCLECPVITATPPSSLHTSWQARSKTLSMSSGDQRYTPKREAMCTEMNETDLSVTGFSNLAS